MKTFSTVRLGLVDHDTTMYYRRTAPSEPYRDFIEDFPQVRPASIV